MRECDESRPLARAQLFHDTRASRVAILRNRTYRIDDVRRPFYSHDAKAQLGSKIVHGVSYGQLWYILSMGCVFAVTERRRIPPQDGVCGNRVMCK